MVLTMIFMLISFLVIAIDMDGLTFSFFRAEARDGDLVVVEDAEAVGV